MPDNVRVTLNWSAAAGPLDDVLGQQPQAAYDTLGGVFCVLENVNRVAWTQVPLSLSLSFLLFPSHSLPVHDGVGREGVTLVVVVVVGVGGGGGGDDVLRCAGRIGRESGGGWGRKRWTGYRLTRCAVAEATMPRPTSGQHYRGSTIQPPGANVSLAWVSALGSALRCGFQQHWQQRVPRFIAAACLQLPVVGAGELSVARLWSHAATASLVYMLVRFLVWSVTAPQPTSASAAAVYRSIVSTCSPLRRLSPSPRATVPSIRTPRRSLALLRNGRSAVALTGVLPGLVLEAVAVPVYVIHQVGYHNLPARRPGESLCLRCASIAVLTPLWILAVAATMVLLTFGAVVDFFGRGLRRMFGRWPRAAPTGAGRGMGMGGAGSWYQLDVERAAGGGGGWQPDSATSSSIDDLTKLPGGWDASGRVWDDLRRDQGALLRERDNLDAEKAAWKLECARARDEKRAVELERLRLQADRAAFAEQQQRWRQERAAAERAKQEVEAILRGFIDKSRKKAAVIADMRRGIERGQKLMAIHGHPTPPASPRVTKITAREAPPAMA